MGQSGTRWQHFTARVYAAAFALNSTRLCPSKGTGVAAGVSSPTRQARGSRRLHMLFKILFQDEASTIPLLAEDCLDHGLRLCPPAPSAENS